jgi:hypothetical protein
VAAVVVPIVQVDLTVVGGHHREIGTRPILCTSSAMRRGCSRAPVHAVGHRQDQRRLMRLKVTS